VQCGDGDVHGLSCRHGLLAGGVCGACVCVCVQCVQCVSLCACVHVGVGVCVRACMVGAVKHGQARGRSVEHFDDAVGAAAGQEVPCGVERQALQALLELGVAVRRELLYQAVGGYVPNANG